MMCILFCVVMLTLLVVPALAASLRVWPVSPQDVILPDSPPAAVAALERLQGNPLRVTACRGQYEPCTFVVYAEQDLREVRLAISDLVGPGGRIPASAIDARAVLCWWQDEGLDAVIGKRAIIPELLVHNPGLITRDDAKQDNVLHFEGLPEDAAELHPVDIPAGSLQQFWLTVHVPQDAQSGGYTGTVTVTASDGEPTEVALALVVPDFDLLPSGKDHAIFYRGQLNPEGATSGGDPLGRTEARYRAELRDLVAHGFTQVSIWEGADPATRTPDFTRLKRALDIRREEGALAGPVQYMEHVHGLALGQATPEEIRAQTRRILEFFRENGYPEPLFYGHDEVYGEPLRKARVDYRAINDAGGRVVAACRRGYFSDIGEVLNVPILVSDLGREVGDSIRATQACGGRVWFYYPQSSLEDPLVWRHLTGFWLWARGLDGCAPFAYQSPGDVSAYTDWGPGWRPHMFTYPTRTGVLDTIHWEAAREGLDDVRYCTTLWAHLRLARELGRSSPRLEQTQAWFDGLRIEYPARPESVAFTAPTDLKRRQDGWDTLGVRRRLTRDVMHDYLADLRAQVIEHIEALRAEFPGLRTDEARARLRQLASEAKTQHIGPPPTEAEIAATYANLYGLAERYKEQRDWLNAYRIGERLVAFTESLDPARWTDLREAAWYMFTLYRIEFLGSPQFAEAYEEVIPAPGGWLFRTDPHQAGVAERWFGESAPGEWRPISVDKSWEEQGYPDYDGDGWYRVTFAAPQSLAGRRVFAYLGQLDNMGWIYLNGEKVYDHTFSAERAGTPLLVDLTARLRVGQQNLLVVRGRDLGGEGGGLSGGVKIVSPREW